MPHATLLELRNNLTCAIHKLLRTYHELGGVIIVLTDVFKQLRICSPAKVEAARPRFCIRTGIIDCYVILHRVGIGPCQLLDHMKLVGMRCSLTINPEFFVEANRIDDKCVTLPTACRVTVKARKKLLGMRSAVHINLSLIHISEPTRLLSISYAVF